jgi:UDP-N-acetylglucosamine--N-acetylmuramyl-(pentapeptide) pyrophosphoryl-undecaprenol N-acetylglucosamine transferase
MRIVIAAGGTGGHLLPGVAVGKALRARGHQVHFVVKTDHSSQAYLAKEGFPSSAFFLSGFPRGLSGRLLTYPFQFGAAFLSARRILKRELPDVVLGMGGYISVPTGLAAAARGIPLVLHEQNSCAGLANRLLSRRAAAVGTTFERTERLPGRPGLLVHTGLPIRPDLVPQDPREARRRLELGPDDMTVLVFGGSQGARALNRLVTLSLPALEPLRDRWQFIHLTGEAEFQAVKTVYKTLGWRAFVRSYWSDMATLYSAADFVVGRAGANTVMELARMGKRALLVPFPHATDNHQEKNARVLEDLGAAQVVTEKDLSEARFQMILRELPAPDVLREQTSVRLSRVTPQLLNAADRVADLVEKTASGVKT